MRYLSLDGLTYLWGRLKTKFITSDTKVVPDPSKTVLARGLKQNAVQIYPRTIASAVVCYAPDGTTSNVQSELNSKLDKNALQTITWADLSN